MKKCVIVLLFVLFQLLGVSQKNQYEGGDVDYVTNIPEQYLTRFNSIHEIPDSLLTFLTKQTKKRCHHFYNQFTFKLLEKIDVAQYFNDYPDSLNNYWIGLFSQMAIYTWRDSTIGVGSYDVKLFFDKLGQVYYQSFPFIENPAEYNDLMKLDEALAQADSIIKSTNFNFNERTFDLFFHQSWNELQWEIKYIRDNNENGSYIDSNIRTLLYSLKTHELRNDNVQQLIYFRF